MFVDIKTARGETSRLTMSAKLRVPRMQENEGYIENYLYSYLLAFTCTLSQPSGHMSLLINFMLKSYVLDFFLYL